jgi:Asp-tRNA(Asn)/Glu-tRNA(Gln) amidotransferase A subunit family amidase
VRTAARGFREADFIDAATVNAVGQTIPFHEAALSVGERPYERMDRTSCREIPVRLAAGRLISDREYQAAPEQGREFRVSFETAMAGIDAMLLPTCSSLAPLRGSLSARTQLTQYTRLANVVGGPAISLPVHEPSCALASECS